MAEGKSKISKILSLVDESFDHHNTINYHLSIQTGIDSFAYCILDSSNNKYIVLEISTFHGIHTDAVLCETLETIIKENPLFNNPFKSVNVSIVNNRSTLIPTPLFENESKEDYLQFNHTLSKDESILTDHLKNLDAKNLFAVSNCLLKTIHSLFPKHTVHHYSTILIESLITTFKNQNNKKVVIHIQHSNFEILVLESKNLLFYNSFRHYTSEDFIYYVLFVFEQLKLNPENTEVTLLGEIERNSAIYSILQKYIRHIKFGERTESFLYSHKLNGISKHFYYNLFNQLLCV